MRKQTKIILAVSVVVLILIGLLVLKLSWFGAGMKPLTTHKKADTIANTADAKAEEEMLQAEDTRAIYEQKQFPTSANSVKDFVIEPYEIAMEDEGLLNNDDLKDVVLVLANKNDSTDLRPTLVLLKQQTGGYLLYGVSWHTVGPAYNSDKFQEYIQEEVEIDSAKLKISLYGYGGPTGNQFNTYQFIGNKLVLSKLELYNAGAGGQTYVDVDYLKNMVRVEDVSTMLEDMPSKISHKKIPKHKPYFFETDEGLDFRLY